MKALYVGAALALAIAAPASAQLVGGAVGGAAGGGLGRGMNQSTGVGAGGNLGGSVGMPDMGAARGAAGGAIQGTRSIGSGVVGDTRGVVRGTADDLRSGVAADGSSSAAVSADRRGVNASASAEVTTGLTLQSRTGQTLGTITGVVRNRAGQIRSLTVRTVDGAVRTMPPAAVSVEGGAAVTNYSSADIRSLPRPDR